MVDAAMAASAVAPNSRRVGLCIVFVPPWMRHDEHSRWYGNGELGASRRNAAAGERLSA
jgi:hypothetical protein